MEGLIIALGTAADVRLLAWDRRGDKVVLLRMRVWAFQTGSHHCLCVAAVTLHEPWSSEWTYAYG